jgi:putative heme-binding domain-containing protein
LYRLRWTGALQPAAPATSHSTPGVVARKKLEALHGRDDPLAIATAWPHLASPDPFVRRAARVAVESQPKAGWRDRALAEREPRASVNALLALARVDAPANQAEILRALRRLHEAGLDASLRGEWLRVLSLAFSRGGHPPDSVRATWATVLAQLFPLRVPELDAVLLELLVYCEAPDIAAKGMAAIREANTRQQQLDFAKSLRVLRTQWTDSARQEFFDWLAQTAGWRGGGTFGRFLQRIRDDALAAVPDGERAALSARLAAAIRNAPTADYALGAGRRVVREWTTDDLTMLAQSDTLRRDVARGRKIFGAAGCFGCHTFDQEGGALGPDLTAVGRRVSVRDLIQAIVEPNREISDQYGTVELQHRDGRRLFGRIVNLTENGLHLAENLADPSTVVRLAEADIVSIAPSRQSLMPGGLLNTFSADEILDLLAFMRQSPPAER